MRLVTHFSATTQYVDSLLSQLDTRGVMLESTRTLICAYWAYRDFSKCRTVELGLGGGAIPDGIPRLRQAALWAV